MLSSVINERIKKNGIIFLYDLMLEIELRIVLGIMGVKEKKKSLTLETWY